MKHCLHHLIWLVHYAFLIRKPYAKYHKRKHATRADTVSRIQALSCGLFFRDLLLKVEIHESTKIEENYFCC